MGSTAIHIRNLVVGFGSKTILNHLNLDVRQGEILGLVGASGGGKSVLMRALVGLLPKRGGQIDYVDHGKGERNWGILFQQGALFSALTARQNVQFPLRENAHLSPRLLDEIADAKLEMVGLSRADGDKFPSELSGGMTKRVALARALAVEPKLIICDEPVSALDVSIRSQILNLLRDLQDRLKLAYIFVSHDLAVVKHIADRVAVMNLGTIVETADAQALFAAPRHPYSRALLSAIPVPKPRAKRSRIVLEGELPSALNPPSGCRFHTRCPYVIARCRSEVPPLREDGTGYATACHRTGELPGAEAIVPSDGGFSPTLEKLVAAFNTAEASGRTGVIS